MSALSDTERLIPHGEPIGLDDIRDALVIKEDKLFLMTDQEGNMPAGSMAGYGLYKDDTRYLSVFDLSLDGVKPMVLLSSAEMGFGSEHQLTNPHMSDRQGRDLPKDSVEIIRQRIIKGSFLEIVQVTNFNIFPIEIGLRFHLNADFADIFEVRGERRLRRGQLDSPRVSPSGVAYGRQGLDGVHRTTTITFSPQPAKVWNSGALFYIKLRHRESLTFTLRVIPGQVPQEEHFFAEFEYLQRSYRDWLDRCTSIFTDNEFFNAMLDRALKDVRMLVTSDHSGSFIAAGTPWFQALFGRDSLITSLQMLAMNPDLARTTLRILASWQGQKYDDWRDEEPGKILHELRMGEMASMGEIPMTPYYGSVDSTLLFIMVATQYVGWTADLDLIRELEPSIMTAFQWITQYGDLDRCGYVEYSRRSPKGILNQGWKDSNDGIVNADGTMVKPPIALVEIQAYVYAAKRGMAWLLYLLGHTAAARRLNHDAKCLKGRFNTDFWMAEENFYALALAGDKSPAGSITSNPGHCLWTGIADGDKAIMVAERLFAPDMFSGWGIRTLSSASIRYNPMGYHLGSVWPHDNAIIGMGFKRYGLIPELNELATAIYDSARTFDYYRLPELFCGTPRSLHNKPVRYPVACRPQAWAAGSIPMLLQAVLGLVPNAMNNELVIVAPQLPHWLREVEVRGLRLGQATIDVFYQKRNGRTVVSVPKGCTAKVTLARKWPTRKIAY